MAQDKDLTVAFPKPCDEAWDGMIQQGCHRHCESCDKVVHDLEAMTLGEAEALMASDNDACVRARIGADGAVQLANGGTRGQSQSQGRLKAALGGAATLALAACSTTDGPAVSPRFTLEGTVEPYQRNAEIILEGEARTYKTRPENDATFQFINLKPGTYRLKTRDYCGTETQIEQLQIGENDISLGKLEWEADCIIVGKMEPADPPSRA